MQIPLHHTVYSKFLCTILCTVLYIRAAADVNQLGSFRLPIHTDLYFKGFNDFTELILLKAMLHYLMNISPSLEKSSTRPPPTAGR